MRNCRKVSSVRFRDRCHETDVMNWVNIRRQEPGKVDSDGKSGSYQYLPSESAAHFQDAGEEVDKFTLTRYSP